MLQTKHSRLLLYRIDLVPKGLHRHLTRRQDGSIQEGRRYQVDRIPYQYVLDNFSRIFDDHCLKKTRKTFDSKFTKLKLCRSGQRLLFAFFGCIFHKHALAGCVRRRQFHSAKSSHIFVRRHGCLVPTAIVPFSHRSSGWTS